MFARNRVIRTVSCSMLANRSLRASSDSASQDRRSDPAAPRMLVSGVRRSCDSEFSSAVRSFWVSAWASLRAAAAARRTRSSTMADWSARAESACDLRLVQRGVLSGAHAQQGRHPVRGLHGDEAPRGGRAACWSRGRSAPDDPRPSAPPPSCLRPAPPPRRWRPPPPVRRRVPPARSARPAISAACWTISAQQLRLGGRPAQAAAEAGDPAQALDAALRHPRLPPHPAGQPAGGRRRCRRTRTTRSRSREFVDRQV